MLILQDLRHQRFTLEMSDLHRLWPLPLLLLRIKAQNCQGAQEKRPRICLNLRRFILETSQLPPLYQKNFQPWVQNRPQRQHNRRMDLRIRHNHMQPQFRQRCMAWISVHRQANLSRVRPVVEGQPGGLIWLDLWLLPNNTLYHLFCFYSNISKLRKYNGRVAISPQTKKTIVQQIGSRRT